MQKQTDTEAALLNKYPEPVVLVTTRSAAGRPNVMAAGWVMLASDDPVMFALGIDDESYTYALIRETREFVVAFPHEGMARETLYAGTHHGHKIEKLTLAGLTAQDGVKVKAPLLADAIANFECELVEITKPGNCPLIVGKVIAAHENATPGLRRLFNTAKGYKLGGVSSKSES
ncbi:MAG: Flavoredoxin [Verrucomicrobia bacterium ADurb.Bin345]|nr:MAG: Flavoredoxin [Verrucomicrobia bacterium ADurb.Bin345]